MDFNNEIWKDIKGYEGLYQISNYGRVKSLPRLIYNGNNHYKLSKEKIRKPQINNKRHGYCEITLSKNNIKKRHKINRLVALAFIPNPNNKPEVNHKDGNKQNNCVDNLEWVTSKENKQHGWENNLYNSNHRKRKIICNETQQIFESVIDCSKKLNLDRRTIFRVLKGERKSCKGYTFKYID